MKTTLDIGDDLILHAKAQALAEGKSLTELIDQALQQYLKKEVVFAFGSNSPSTSGPTISEMTSNSFGAATPGLKKTKYTGGVPAPTDE